MKATEKMKAIESAGFRERYAMEKGKEHRKTVNGHILYIFCLPVADAFSVANGATYDATRGTWIG